LPCPSSKYAFARKSSPLACAKRHVSARWLVKLDIHDFFESISERRVYFAFHECGYQPLVAFELARLCTRVHSLDHTPDEWQSTHRRPPGVIDSYADGRVGHLPQGAPTSPMLSNIVSRPLDELLDRLARRDGLVYTRYSDDIAFSTDGDLTRGQIRTLINDATRVFDAFGHSVHRKKITVAPPGSRRLILGLLVDGDKARLTRTYRSRVETHLRGIEKFGLAAHAATRHFTSIWGMIRHVEGLIAHACAVDVDYGGVLRARLAETLNKSGWSSL
jgi:RNA-directed DNA polymerase